MLPFDRKPWARQVAAIVIAVTLLGAICVPIVLHYRKALDLPIVVGIVLLLLAIIPPNVVILRRRTVASAKVTHPPLYAARSGSR